MNKMNKDMSTACRVQLTKRQQINVKNVKTSKTFFSACHHDIIENSCFKQTTNALDMTMSIVLLCLENAEKQGIKLEPNCIGEMTDHRKMLMEDYSLTPNLVKYCQAEITEFCRNGLEKGGKTIHCLFSVARRHKNKIKPECLVELKTFMKVVNPAEDVRVDPHLYEVCHNLIQQGPCSHVTAGHGHIIECLTRQLDTPNMREECQERILEIQFFVVRDWTLNTEFYSACKKDAVKFCKVPEKWFDSSSMVDAKIVVLPCLYHHIDDQDIEDIVEENEHVSKNCAVMVRDVMLKRAKKYELLPQVQDACSFFLAKLCSNTEITEKNQEIRCLQQNYKQLDNECQDEVKRITKYQNDDIRLDQILYNSCLPTIEKYCANKREEKGTLLECLIEQKNNGDIQYKCLVGIEHHQILNLNDVSLNPKFRRNCFGEIKEHCQDKKSKLEVVYCLSEMVLNDTLLASQQRVGHLCKNQLRFELLQTSENINLDPELANACNDDITNFCQNIKAGKGQIVECLRSHQSKISKVCQTKLFKREKIESLDDKTDYSLQTTCKIAIEKYCHVDSTTSIVDCLRTKLVHHGLGEKCRRVVINRIITQNKDIRLNPKLYKACEFDIPKLCNRAFANLKNSDEPANSQVITCLKRNFIKSRLSKTCLIEVSEIMREAANVDFRLDPLLAENCLNELETLCHEEPNDSKETCLRLKFQQMKIDKESTCYHEVKRIIVEGAADVFVDHDLSRLCESDLAKFCSDVPPGSAQHLKCLMDAKSLNKNKFSARCAEALDSRKQLWKMARVNDEINDLNDLAYLINVSHKRSYLFTTLMLMAFCVFLLGFCCRPMLYRSRQDKLK